MTVSSVAVVARAAPALLRWATVAQPGVAARSAATSMGEDTQRTLASAGDPRADGAAGRHPGPDGVDRVGGMDATPPEPGPAAGGLDERTVDPDPLVQFGRWYQEAAAAVDAPEAMALATADGLKPSSQRADVVRIFGEGFRLLRLHGIEKFRYEERGVEVWIPKDGTAIESIWLFKP